MAKRDKMTEPETPPVEVPTPRVDVNPQLAFQAAWDRNTENMREVLTRTHELRGGLRPSQIDRARRILVAYGL
jgi:hypothetical protein